MSEAQLIELLIQLGIDGTLALLKAIKGVNTIDDAIAALGSVKAATQYLKDAKQPTG